MTFTFTIFLFAALEIGTWVINYKEDVYGHRGILPTFYFLGRYLHFNT